MQTQVGGGHEGSLGKGFSISSIFSVQQEARSSAMVVDGEEVEEREDLEVFQKSKEVNGQEKFGCLWESRVVEQHLKACCHEF